MLKFDYQTKADGLRRIFDRIFIETEDIMEYHRLIYWLSNRLASGDILESELSAYLTEKGKDFQYKTKINDISKRYDDVLKTVKL